MAKTIRPRKLTVKELEAEVARVQRVNGLQTIVLQFLATGQSWDYSFHARLSDGWRYKLHLGRSTAPFGGFVLIESQLPGQSVAVTVHLLDDLTTNPHDVPGRCVLREELGDALNVLRAARQRECVSLNLATKGA
jgi:hypothetical protein